MQQTYLLPGECMELNDLGLKSRSESFWTLKAGELCWDFSCKHADPMGLYEDHAMPVSIRPEVQRQIPAYSVTELIDKIPDVFISRLNGIYQITGGEEIISTPVKDKELGRAVFKMIYILLKERKLQPEK